MFSGWLVIVHDDVETTRFLGGFPKLFLGDQEESWKAKHFDALKQGLSNK